MRIFFINISNSILIIIWENEIYLLSLYHSFLLTNCCFLIPWDWQHWIWAVAPCRHITEASVPASDSVGTALFSYLNSTLIKLVSFKIRCLLSTPFSQLFMVPFNIYCTLFFFKSRPHRRAEHGIMNGFQWVRYS